MPPSFPHVPGLSGPPPAPFWGMRGNITRFLADPIAYLGEIHGRYGKIAAVTRNVPFMVSALGPEFNRQILSDGKLFYTVSPEAVDAVRESEENSLTRLTKAVVSSNGPRHQQQRKLIMPSLHRNAVATYVEKMVSNTLEIIETWKPGQRIDAFQEMKRITLRLAMKVLLGIVPEEHGGDALAASYGRWMELNAALANLLFSRNRLPGSHQWKLLQCSNRLEKQALGVLEFKRQNPGTDVLSMLIQAVDEGGEKLNREELVANTHILFIIGHQTMTDVLTWTLFCLSQHPEMLAKVRDEVDTVLRGAPPTLQDLDRLQLLNWSIDEALRLLGPTIYQFRIAQDRFQLGPFEMPKHSWVIFSPHYTHRMPEVYPNPNRYLPLRWETASPGPFEYLPFTFGAHGCIGPQFAYTEMKIILALMLQRMQLTLAPDARIDRTFNPTLVPKHGMPMVVLDRGATFQRNLARGDVHDILEIV